MADVITLPDGRDITLPDPDAIYGYAKLTRWPGQDLDLCRLAFAEGMDDFFPQACKIMNEQEGRPTFLDITPAQHLTLKKYREHKYVIVNKYRQAKISTITLMKLLQDCMLLEGHNGIIVGNKSETAEEIFRRVTYAYDQMAADPELAGMVAPKDPARKAVATAIFFKHGGSIQLMSAGAISVGSGFSVDRLAFTEVGEVEDLESVNKNLFPAMWKRPHARIWLESTPGKLSTEHERLWLESVDGKTRFHALFLEWWRDDTCWKDPSTFDPTPDDLVYMERHPGMELGHLAYRREAIASIYSGSSGLFSSKHPSHARDGWLGGATPTFATDPLLLMRGQSLEDPEPDIKSGVGVFKVPQAGRKYCVVCDPNRFGEEGDVSAIVVMDMHSHEEVAVWEDREDPIDVAERCAFASDYYNKALIIMEANAEGAVTSLVDNGYGDRLYWMKRKSPGWWASTLSIQRGEARLSEMIQTDDIVIRSKKTVDQIISYSPKSRKRRTRGQDGNTKHYDRARCLVMYADVRALIYVPPPAKVVAENDLTEAFSQVMGIPVNSRPKEEHTFGMGVPYSR